MSTVEVSAVGGVSFEEALEQLEPAVAVIFDADPGVRSVGITRHGEGFGYRAVRNSRIIRPLSAPSAPLTHFGSIPIRMTDVPAEVQTLLRVPHTGAATPSATSVLPEVLRHRPLVCGLQIQNFDDDVRQGVVDEGHIIIGTLGCFVRSGDGILGFLSNNHVVAGQNRGQNGQDRILQPGSGAFDNFQQIGTLLDYVPLAPSPAGAKPSKGNVIYNDVDAGAVKLLEGLQFSKGYLASRPVPAPQGIAPAIKGDLVFKVGRTTGLTYGLVEEVATVVGPVPYDPGDCWFRRSIVVEGVNGTTFSDHGDSGSAVVKTTGEVIGLLYAGNGFQTYVCPIDDVLRALNCSLV